MQDKSTSINYLLDKYFQRITPGIDRSQFASFLKEDILPAYHVVQSALVTLTNDGQFVTLYCKNIPDHQLPTYDDKNVILAQADKYRPFKMRAVGPCRWVRLILPVRIGDALLGFWLLGQRAPDRVYRKSEIAELSMIAYHVALWLTMINERERIRAIYQANIDRNENERAKLARDLHDDILNQLAVIAMSTDDEGISPEAIQKVEGIIHHVRQMVSSLRPGMLNYGLRAALESLVGDLSYLAGSQTKIKLDIPRSDMRYAVKIEEYVFRIVQEACVNALRHAQAQNIRIAGKLEPMSIELLIADDGVGFLEGKKPELSHLLRNKHFGLVGMFERAELIGAVLQIDSKYGSGTKVRINWGEKKDDEGQAGCA